VRKSDFVVTRNRTGRVATEFRKTGTDAAQPPAFAGMKIDVRVFHERRRALPVIVGVGIGLVLSCFAHGQSRVMLGVLVVTAPLTVLSGCVGPVENMVHAIEGLGRADLIDDRQAALWRLVLQAMQLNARCNGLADGAVRSAGAGGCRVPGAAGGGLTCEQPQRGESSCQATAPISPALTGTPRIMRR
jgi:hypothetical protein